MPYLGNSPDNIVRAKQDAYKFVATSGQTIFTGADANGSTLTFAPTDFIAVFLNGVRLIETDDYTKSSNAITLSTGATTGDELIITAFAQVLSIDSYSKAQVDTLVTGAVTTAATATAAAITSDNVTDDGNALLNALIFGG